MLYYYYFFTIEALYNWDYAVLQCLFMLISFYQNSNAFFSECILIHMWCQQPTACPGLTRPAPTLKFFIVYSNSTADLIHFEPLDLYFWKILKYIYFEFSKFGFILVHFRIPSVLSVERKWYCGVRSTSALHNREYYLDGNTGGYQSIILLNSLGW